MIQNSVREYNLPYYNDQDTHGTYQVEPVPNGLCVHGVVLHVLAGLADHHDGLGAGRRLLVPARDPHLVQVLHVLHTHRHLVRRDDLMTQPAHSIIF